MTTTRTFYLGVGDDWVMPVTYTDSAIVLVNGSGGSGYTHASATVGPPRIGGRQATLTTAISGGGVTLAISDPGDGYDPGNPPAITIIGDGQGASATTKVGSPINLTGSVVGGDLYFYGQTRPVIEMTVANNGIIAWDPANGAFTFCAPLSLTANAVPENPAANTFQNRLQIWVIDSLGHRKTIAVFAITVFDPRTVEPATFPQSQVGNAVAGGTQGPAGANPNLVIRNAVGAVSGHKLVKAVSGGVSYASSNAPGDAGLLLGLTLTAASDSTPVQILSAGEITEQTWSWSLGPVYLGLAGALTQTPPTSGLYQQVGIATSATSLLVDIQDPIVRP